MARAVLNNSGSNSTQGASTLTQQLVKQTRFFEAGSDKAKQNAATADTTNRKIYEAKCALKLEQEYSKHSILQQYFNIAFFGEQSYGIDVAASTYFHTTPAHLSVPQAAMLAGLVKDPALFDPFQHPTAARERRNEVIDNMVVAGDLTQAQATKYKKAPFVLNETTRHSLGAQGLHLLLHRDRERRLLLRLRPELAGDNGRAEPGPAPNRRLQDRHVDRPDPSEHRDDQGMESFSIELAHRAGPTIDRPDHGRGHLVHHQQALQPRPETPDE